MLDFSNPYLGKQEIADMLLLEVSKEAKEEREEMAKQGLIYSSRSYWKLKVRDFVELTRSSTILDTPFCGKMMENWYHPDLDILLMEHDRNEAGEWDYALNRFTPIGYQNVLAVAVGGLLRGEVPKNNEEIASEGWSENNGVYSFSMETYGELLAPYSRSKVMSENREPFRAIGIWDIPIKELNAYEGERVYKRTYYFSQEFERSMEQSVGIWNNWIKRGVKKGSALKTGKKGFQAQSTKNKKRGKKK
tara:strand:+ start:106 stop:849 length:744 start_codon:yes stop_codon:yes gene_type:complete